MYIERHCTGHVTVTRNEGGLQHSVTAVDGTAGAKLDYRPTFQYASKDTRPVSVESISAMSSSAFTAFCVAAAGRLEVEVRSAGAGTRLQHTTDVVQHQHVATVRQYCYRRLMPRNANKHRLGTRTQSQQQWHTVAQGTSLAGPESLALQAAGRHCAQHHHTGATLKATERGTARTAAH